MEPTKVIGQAYTGPYVSNNKFQESVAFGDYIPVDQLDAFSRLHDTSYYVYKDSGHRKAADSIYADDVSHLGAAGYGAAGIVHYGNPAYDSASNLTNHTYDGFKIGGLIGAVGGLVYGSVENSLTLYDYMLHSEEYKKDVKKLYSTDPYSDARYMNPYKQLGKSPGPVGLPAGPGASVNNTDVTVGGGLEKEMSKGIKLKPKAAAKLSKALNRAAGVRVNKPNKPSARPSNPLSKVAKKKAPKGAITSITTAPVAIGNSIRGCESVVTSTSGNGVMVRGRDFMFSALGSGAVQTWTMVGGTPLSPAAFSDTTLANYMRLYAKFRFRSFVVHFITSSPTTANGDVMFYYGKDRSSVFLNQTSPQLLGFVLSDPSTTLGPQWTNHSAALTVTGDWKLTDYGMHDGIEEYADGELFLLSRTSSTDSPGYVMFDYVVEFAEHQLQPRLLTFPIPRAQWHQSHIGFGPTAVVKGNSIIASKGLFRFGNDISGGFSTLPGGIAGGDVYKVIIDLTNSDQGAWINVLNTNAFSVNTGNSSAVTIVDGMTIYSVYDAVGQTFAFYPNATSAFAESTPIAWGVTDTITINLQVWFSYIGSLSTANLVPNF